MNPIKHEHQDITASIEPSLFAVEEFDSFYLVSLDLPGCPGEAPQVIRSEDELSVRSSSGEIFHLKSKGRGTRVSYENGSLWLMLPKESIKKERLQS